MNSVLPLARRLALAALLAVPGLAFGQEPPKPVRPPRTVIDESKSMGGDAKLAELEAKLQALLKEIQALRSAPQSAAPPATYQFKPSVIENKTVEGHTLRVVPATGEGDRVLRLAPGTGDKKVVVTEEKKVETGSKDGKDTIIIIDGKTGARKVISADELKGLEKALRDKTDKGVKVHVDVEDLKGLKEKIEKEVHGKVEDAKNKVEKEVRWRVEDATKKAADAQKRVEWAQEKVEKAEKGDKANQPRRVEPPATYYRTVTSSSGESMSLTRTTYSLPAGKAAALASFLKEITSVKVLETKVEGDRLTVTTTPDAQNTISQLVGLMTGQTRASNTLWSTKPAPEAKPKPQQE